MWPRLTSHPGVRAQNLGSLCSSRFLGQLFLGDLGCWKQEVARDTSAQWSEPTPTGPQGHWQWAHSRDCWRD